MAHTADMIIEAWAPDRETCLAELVAALTDVYAEASPGARALEVRVDVSGFDDADLVLALLEECLYLLDARAQVALGADLSPAEGRPLAVRGKLRVVSADEVEVIGAIPKAIAEPDLRHRPETGLWEASVIVDV